MRFMIVVIKILYLYIFILNFIFIHIVTAYVGTVGNAGKIVDFPSRFYLNRPALLDNAVWYHNAVYEFGFIPCRNFPVTIHCEIYIANIKNRNRNKYKQNKPTDHMMLSVCNFLRKI